MQTISTGTTSFFTVIDETVGCIDVNDLSNVRIMYTNAESGNGDDVGSRSFSTPCSDHVLSFLMRGNVRIVKGTFQFVC